MSYASEARGLRALARLVVLPLLGIAVGLGAAYVVTAEMTPTYRATASVVVLPKEQKKASSSDLTDVSLALNVSPSVARLAESREVANTVATRLGLPENEVFGKATAVSEPGNQIVTVQAEAESPVTAAKIANEVTKATTALYNQLRLSGKSGVTVQALDVAAPPAAPVSPRPLLNYALGALVGLLIGVGVATLRSRSDDRFRGVRELEKRLGLPTLGLLRSLPRWPRDAARLYGRRGIRASVDATVAAVSVLRGDHRGGSGGVRVLVTSVGADRPTPRVAALLAHGLARQGHRAVVVDGQPRRHGVDRLVDPSLTATVETVLDPANDGVPVRLVTSTALAEHLGDALEPEAVAALITPLAARADALVITAPPVFSGRTLAALAAEVDVVLLVVDSDQVGQPAATRAGLLVRRLQVPLAGTLVIGTAVERDGAQPAVWSPPVGAGLTRRAGRAGRAPEAQVTEPVTIRPVAVEPVAAALAGAEPAAVVDEPPRAEPRAAGPRVAGPMAAAVAPEPIATAATIEAEPEAPLARTFTSRRWLFAKPVGRHAAGSTSSLSDTRSTNGHGPNGNGTNGNGTNGNGTNGHVKGTVTPLTGVPQAALVETQAGPPAGSPAAPPDEKPGAPGRETGHGAAPHPADDDDTHVIPAAGERARRSLPTIEDDTASDDDTGPTRTCPPRRVRAWAS